ncbi:nucleotide-binding protein [Acrasis kona]|uniref:Nucleotide-binding protein n=1 Tax=Acrasis kona TaxID=1008807 RepID=A0AAW2YW18_9EUKA
MRVPLVLLALLIVFVALISGNVPPKNKKAKTNSIISNFIKKRPTLKRTESNIEEFNRLTGLIDNYLTKQVELTDAARDALNDLKQGTIESKVARTKFLKFLGEKITTFPNNAKSTRESVRMADLITSEGANRYEEAIKEEAKSANFREAVFFKACKYYNGQKWTGKPKVIFEGGPSASGKSFGAGFIIGHLSKEDKSATNLVVSIDGGIERELSQMRKMVLGVALKKGYSDISDLHSRSDLLSIKGKLEKYSTKHKLNLILPVTFVNPLERFKMNDYSKKGYHVIFSEVKGAPTSDGKDDPNFKLTVRFQGESRAKFTKTKAPPLSMNAEIPCESKEYKDFFDYGVSGTETARKAYLESDIPDKKWIIVHNDRMFFKFKDEALLPAVLGDKELKSLTKRQYEAYMSDNPDQQTTESLKDWLSKNNRETRPELTNAIVVEGDVTKKKTNLFDVIKDTIRRSTPQ